MNPTNITERFNRRAKFALVGILAVASFAHLGTAFVWNPIQAKRSQIKKLQLDRQQAQQVSLRAEQATAYSRELQANSLSANPMVVAHRYHEWLLKMAEQVEGVTVTPLPTVNLGTIGNTVAFQLEGNCPIEWLANLVEHIERTPLLHKISYFSLDHQSPNSVQFSCKLEALAAANAETMTNWPEPQPASNKVSLSSYLAQHQHFERGYPGPQPIEETMVAIHESEPETIVATETIDPFDTLKLVGSVQYQGQSQVWIFDGRTNQEIFAPENGQFTFAAQQFEVKKISPDFVEIDHPNGLIRWPLGATLRSALN